MVARGRRSIKASKPSCRYCLESKTTQQNYLFAPCACKGSVEYVHYACFMRWFFTCDPADRMICPICKTYYATTPLDSLEKVSPVPPPTLRTLGHPIFSILVFHYLFSVLALFLSKYGASVTDIYLAAILAYQALFFGLLLKHTHPNHPLLYVKAYWTRKNWALPVFQVATLCFLGYNPTVFFVAGVCANGLLSFYWPAHVETVYECNAMELDDMAVRLTLMNE